MSTPSDPTNNERQDAEDALVDAALNETIGGEVPTDQRDEILARAADEKPMPFEEKEPSPKSYYQSSRFVVEFSITAALIMVLATVLLLSPPSVMERGDHTALLLEEEIASSQKSQVIGVNKKLDEFEIRYQTIDAETQIEEEPVASAPGGETTSNESPELELSRQINDANSKPKSLPAITADSDKPFRQGSFDAQVPTFDGPSSAEVKDGTTSALQSMQSFEQSGGPFTPNRPTAAVTEGDVRKVLESRRRQFAQETNGDKASKTRRAITFAEKHSSIESKQLTTEDLRFYTPAELDVDGKLRKEAGYFLRKKEPLYVVNERLSRNQYDPIYENAFIQPKGEDALSTFSIDVDTASYANTRQYLLQSNRMPPPNAVRIEELVNYFDYDYEAPSPVSKTPFAANMEVATCPWQTKHRLVRIAIKGREVEQEKRPLSNLVFLVDVSGSMNQPNKLPLVVRGLKQLARRLGENDRVAIVVYASSEGLALDCTPGSERQTILSALDQLAAGGSTAGGAGIHLAYKIAEENFIKGGTNRVLLCTDGDFNVGISNTEALGEMVETKAKESGVFLSVLGFGRGNLNDAMLEKITNQGNGNYSYIDNNAEARKVLVEQMTGTLVTIAKDVKIQVEFNPAKVSRYRLIGYENRVMANEDFNDDTKDAGEIGAGHTVTAFYEVVPTGVALPENVDPLKYQSTTVEESEVASTEQELPTSDELLTLKLRYKQPTEDKSSKLEFTLTDDGKSFDEASQEFRFASSVAQCGLLLRNSEFKGKATYEAVAETVESTLGDDKHGYREEFLDLVDQAKKLASGE